MFIQKQSIYLLMKRWYANNKKRGKKIYSFMQKYVNIEI